MLPLIIGLGALAILSACTSDESPAPHRSSPLPPRDPDSPSEDRDLYTLNFTEPSLLRLHRDLRSYGVSQRRIDCGMVVYSLGRAADMLSVNDRELQVHEVMNTALDMAEENPEHAGFQGLVRGLRESTDLHDALAFALTHSPGNPEVRARRMEEGALQMESMLNTGSGSPEEREELCVGLGDAYFTLGDLDAAERNFRQAAEANPQSHQAAYMVAFTLFHQGRLVEAQSWRDIGFERRRRYSTDLNIYEMRWQMLRDVGE